MKEHNNSNPHSDSGASNEPSEEEVNTLSADLPSLDPEDDLYGHAPFANIIADGISSYTGSDGMVLALYGSWGSGKSTVLNYIEHSLNQLPENEQPIVIRFNPWWFSGRDNLAHAFFSQLQAVLPGKRKDFEDLGKLLEKYAEGFGGLIDLTGMPGRLVGWTLKQIARSIRKPNDVPALKDEISTTLRAAGKRILVFIDDIDRLTPEETHELFTVTKALANFPNVVYFLAFDREVAVHAIEQQLGMPGERYLEKIVQVSFEMPPVDRVALQKALFMQLGFVLGIPPEHLFDREYWAIVYHEGIDPLILVPRDVVRLINTLSVTYPSVRGAVNVVDFVAIEALRIFLPKVYNVIRSNSVHLTGYTKVYPVEVNHEDPHSFRKRLVSEIPEETRKGVELMLERIFPKIGKLEYDSDSLQGWGQAFRACHPELFPIYFRLTMPPGSVSHNEMSALVNYAGTSWHLRKTLLDANNETQPNGLTKAHAILERLMDYVEKDIKLEHVPKVIIDLLDIGDILIESAGKPSKFDPGNIFRVGRPVYHLLKRVAPDQRADVLGQAIKSGMGIAVQLWLLRALDKEARESNDSSKNILLTTREVEKLKPAWLDRLSTLEEETDILSNPELPRILAAWREWGKDHEVRAWCAKATKYDEGLMIFLHGFLQYVRTQNVGETAVKIQPRLNPDWIIGYLDIAECAERLRQLQQRDVIPSDYRDSVSQYLLEYDMLKDGKNPDEPGAFDD